MLNIGNVCSAFRVISLNDHSIQQRFQFFLLSSQGIQFIIGAITKEKTCASNWKAVYKRSWYL
jgi:hypothetical protein